MAQHIKDERKGFRSGDGLHAIPIISWSVEVVYSLNKYFDVKI